MNDGKFQIVARTAADGIYTLDGVKVDSGSALKGIYIIRHNGKSHKVMR